MNKKFVIIDGNSVMHRAYHALPLLSHNGVYTNAVYGFLSMLIKVYKDMGFDYLAVAFDVSKKVFRHNMFSEYKDGRKPMESELKDQFPVIKEVLDKMGVPILEMENFEADDIIGSVCKKFNQVDTYILTGDKDSLQLIDKSTFVCLMKKGISDMEFFDLDHFKEVYGVLPSQFVDVKALMGDKSDNIPGVTKVGEKTALKLICDFSSLDGVYDNLDSLKGKLLENLLKDKDMAFLSLELAKIKTDIPIKRELFEFEFGKDSFKGAFDLMEELGLLSLIKRIDETKEKKTKEPLKKSMPLTEITDLEAFDNALNSLKKGVLSVFLEEDCLYFSDKEKNFVLKTKTDLLSLGIDLKQALLKLYPFMLKNFVVVCDAKKMMKDFDGLGCQLKFDFDISICAYIVEANDKDFSLLALCRKYLEKDTKDAFDILLLFDILKTKMEPFKNIYYDIEHPLIKVLYEMEKAGFKIDTGVLNQLSYEFSNDIERLKQEIYSLCGSEFNISSPKQLSKVLFEDMGLKPLKKTKTGYSTNAEVLEALIDSSPVIKKILDFRELSKLKSTYIDGFLPLIDFNGRVHTEFLQTGTATGRISSKEPNLQNIPVRTEKGRLIRKAFVAKEGCKLVCADYSQIELRILAHLSDDPILLDAFKKGQDIHKRTASEIFGVPLDEVTPDLRRSAKAVNFGIIYGLSPFGLSKNLDIPVGAAKEYIDGYLERYSFVKEYMARSIISAKESGYTSTMFGRRRTVKELLSKNKNTVAFGERIALNTPIQGSAADIIKLSMIKVFDRLKGLDARLILQVHDELIIEASEKDAKAALDILKDAMENVWVLKVPLVVDIDIKESWTK